jgi:hypothetical protein
VWRWRGYSTNAFLTGKADLAQSLIIAILQIGFLKQPLKNKKL